MDNTITFRRESLKAVSPFVSKEQTRFYLLGVHFEKNLMVATDGHVLAVIKDHYFKGEVEPFTLPTETIKQILAVKPLSKSLPVFVRIDLEKKTATVLHEDKNASVPIASFPFTPVEGTFPDWRRVVPNFSRCKKSSPTSINVKVFSVFQSFGDLIKIFPNENPKTPIIVRGREPDIFDAFGVIMPLLTDMAFDPSLETFLGEGKSGDAGDLA